MSFLSVCSFITGLACLFALFGLISCNDFDSSLLPAKRCHYAVLHRLFTANCSSLELTTVPSFINPDTEVLEISNNKLRALHANSFTHLPNLKVLYLNDNLIKSIDPLTFEPLTKLETLDLKGNLFTTLNISYPKSLIRLYLGANTIHMDRLNLQKAHSVQYLSLRKAGLSEVPDIGFLPNLVELDITENSITNISSTHLASFCRLSVLHIDEDVFSPEMYCDCIRFKHYTDGKMTVKNLECRPVDETQIDTCPPPQMEDATAARFDSCQAEWNSRQFPHWAMSSFLFVLFVACIALGIVLWRKRRDGLKRKKKSNAGVEKDKKEPEAKTEPALLA
ncbi:hypothetical protein M8J76_013090 [Diaphorina citri]|nr:hypothetical protein M8J76_013090 [Diaphorina citri]